MASDIASMAQGGGGPARPQAVVIEAFKQEVEGNSVAGVPAVSASTAEAKRPERPPKSKIFALAILASVGAAGLFLASYYFLYPLLASWSAPRKAVVPPAPFSNVPAVKAPDFQHRSFFRQPVDGSFVRKIGPSGQNLQLYDQQLKTFLTGLGSASTFFEILPQHNGSQPLAAADFFSSINAGVLESNFIVSNFNPDLTVFVYREKDKLWPGYVLQLTSNQNTLLFRSDVMKIESASSSWPGLFFESPGVPGGRFQDALVSGQPVRVLNFSNLGSVLAYGWFFKKYLIISTSLEGLKQALRHF